MSEQSNQSEISAKCGRLFVLGFVIIVGPLFALNSLLYGSESSYLGNLFVGFCLSFSLGMGINRACNSTDRPTVMRTKILSWSFMVGLLFGFMAWGIMKLLEDPSDGYQTIAWQLADAFPFMVLGFFMTAYVIYVVVLRKNNSESE